MALILEEEREGCLSAEKSTATIMIIFICSS